MGEEGLEQVLIFFWENIEEFYRQDLLDHNLRSLVNISNPFS